MPDLSDEVSASEQQDEIKPPRERLEYEQIIPRQIGEQVPPPTSDELKRVRVDRIQG